MQFCVRTRRPGNAVATLTPEQFALVEDLILAMTNRKITRTACEKAVMKRLAEAGRPLIFRTE